MNQSIRSIPGVFERVRGSLRRRADAYNTSKESHFEHQL
jgi:hypothetical protein